MKNNLYLYIKCGLCFSIVILFTGGCKKWVEVPAPYTSTNSANVYTQDVTAIAVLTEMYVQIANNNGINGYTFPSLSYEGGLSADELTLFKSGASSLQLALYQNSLSVQNQSDYWNVIYPYIGQANLAIEGLNASTSLTPSIKKELLGEAQFMRAFYYFYLVNLYGDVPLVLNSVYKTTAMMPRTAKAEVYTQIITDLKSAEALLSENYLDATLLTNSTERLRPNHWVAAALLSRVYLYYGNLTKDQSNYANAAIEATKLIQNSSIFGLDSLDKVFLRAGSSNNEAIWQLQNTNANFNTPDAATFILPSTGPNTVQNVYLSPNLLTAFEKGDHRRNHWVDSMMVGGQTYYYSYKYKINANPAPAIDEYEMVFRLGEQFLIRAEAEADNNDPGDAINDLNVIRKRAGLSNYDATRNGPLLTAILHERQVELFTEWGHRWLDLKRTGTIDTVMGSPGNACAKKGGIWKPTDAFYPLSQGELQANPALVQNPGY